jgi:hypothetical protein
MPDYSLITQKLFHYRVYSLSLFILYFHTFVYVFDDRILYLAVVIVPEECP